MTDIGIRCQSRAHFDEFHFFAFLAEVDGTFAACQAAAEDDDVIPDFGLFFIVLVHDDDVVAVQAFDGRDEGAGSSGDDQGLRFFFSCVSRRYFCIQADFDTGLAGQPFIGLSQFVHFPFEGDGLFALQDAADFAFFFHRGRPDGRGGLPYRLHTSRPGRRRRRGLSF